MNDLPTSPRIALIACRVLDAEIAALTSPTTRIVRRTTFDIGLHDQPAVLHARLAAEIETAEAQPDVEVVVLVYGLCGMAIVGLAPRRCRLVMPRAHDCITLFLGSKERYAARIENDPGLYWYSPGWNRNKRVPGPDREADLRVAYTAKFGAEDAEALIEIEREAFAKHSCAAYTDHGLPGDQVHRCYAQDCSRSLGWRFAHHPGDPTLLRQLLHGPWPGESFLVVNPGEQVAFAPDATVIKAVPTVVGTNST